MFEEVLAPLLGGALIGIAATMLMLFYGRVFGVSGIISGMLQPQKSDFGWRVAIVLGFLTGGLLLAIVYPQSLRSAVATPAWMAVLAGLLVGFGTQLGSGCTSGHGICGISRLSLRSIAAVVTFIAAGALTVTLTGMNTGG